MMKVGTNPCPVKEYRSEYKCFEVVKRIKKEL